MGLLITVKKSYKFLKHNIQYKGSFKLVIEGSKKYMKCWLGILCCVISIITISMLVDYLKHLQKIRNIPPGPTPLPAIGNLNMISGKPLHLILTELSEIYGEIYSISIGMDRTVIISETEIANKTLHLKSFSGRCLKNRYFHISTKAIQT